MMSPYLVLGIAAFWLATGFLGLAFSLRRRRERQIRATFARPVESGRRRRPF